MSQVPQYPTLEEDSVLPSMPVSPAIFPERPITPDASLHLSTSLPQHFTPDARRIPSSDSLLSHSISQSHLDYKSDYEHGTSSWRNKSDTCSLSSRVSDAEDDEKLDIYGSSYLSSNPSLPLTPFKNQVGGHASFLRFSEKALCKPHDNREQTFYEKIAADHPELLPFLASYLGIVNVTFRHSVDDNQLGENSPVVLLENNKHLLVEEEEIPNMKEKSAKFYNRKLQQQVFKEALSPKGLRARFAQLKSVTDVLNHHFDQGTPSKFQKPNSPKSLSNTDQSPQLISPMLQSDDEQMFQMSDDEFLKPKTSMKIKKPQNLAYHPGVSADNIDQNPFDSHTETPARKHINPWSVHLYNNRLAKLKAETTDSSIQQFLLLEDLTQGLQFPSILDLKMGTRQHGVNASPEKKLSQERKCERSTSKRLGVRICGMQLYRQDTKSYRYLDKYVGRQINPKNFKQALLSFLDDGQHYLIGHIPGILAKLAKLRDVISTMSTARFYASSLLILYDGQLNPTKEVDIKMIDFANCILSIDYNANYPPTTVGPDSGYLHGLQTLITNFQELYDDLSQNNTITEHGHVLIKSLSNSQRATAEIGLV
ncbi:Inositol hexakisphosphate kinase 1 [Globomyces sp. JEL0801]|nr:Inositol hexakisphosphate kinase 1 [Globomyces sp. JEL0801]